MEEMSRMLELEAAMDLLQTMEELKASQQDELDELGEVRAPLSGWRERSSQGPCARCSVCVRARPPLKEPRIGESSSAERTHT